MPIEFLWPFSITSFLAACLLYRLWHRCSERGQRITIWIAFLSILTLLLAYLTRWSLVSDVGNQIWIVLALFSYTLLSLLVSRRRPRWISMLASAILFVGALMFLGQVLFVPLVMQKVRTDQLASGLIVRRMMFGNRIPTLDLYRRPNAMPLVERQVGKVLFGGFPCIVWEARVTHNPATDLVRVQCPSKDGRVDERELSLR